ncbi:hypothetical protein EYF80_059651 [Liparis tanakae]|uniref:Uncharacterized protein n=1 Tax=Liparis tanakae TaxID=230148 RepID=A0A4Z2EMM8_9TELE|nr:hypothetical protein EYF80_059651 [Liparis tanakae]
MCHVIEVSDSKLLCDWCSTHTHTHTCKLVKVAFLRRRGYSPQEAGPRASVIKPRLSAPSAPPLCSFSPASLLLHQRRLSAPLAPPLCSFSPASLLLQPRLSAPLAPPLCSFSPASLLLQRRLSAPSAPPLCSFSSASLLLPPRLSAPLAPPLCSFSSASLHEPEGVHVAEEDVVLDGREDEADVVRVRGAGEVGVDDAVLVGAESDEHLQDELLRRSGVPLGPWRAERLKYVPLVEEQEHRRAAEPAGGHDGLEQRQALLHAALEEREPCTLRPLTSPTDSASCWSYSLIATRNMMEVTPSKQWSHFLLSDRWPPTSTILQGEET